MSSEKNTSGYDYEREWIKPSIKIGRIATLLIIVVSFLPNIYLYIKEGVFPSMEVAIQSWINVAVMYGAFYFIEPFSYFPIFGTAGSYLAISTGNMANLKLPASTMAQEILEVEHGTPEAEVVSMLGIAGSIITNMILITITVIIGAKMMTVLPEAVKIAFEKYTLPSLFGALYGQLSMQETRVGLYSLPISLAMRILFPGSPIWLFIVVAVVGNVILTKFLYDKDIVK